MLKRIIKLRSPKFHDIPGWCLDSGVYAFDMSEPPSKKRKTILDFFRRKEKGNKKDSVEKKEAPLDSVMSSADSKSKESQITPSDKPSSSKDFSRSVSDENKHAQSAVGPLQEGGSSVSGGASMYGGASRKGDVSRTDSQNSYCSSDGDPTQEYDMLQDFTDPHIPDIPDHKPSQKRDDSLWKGKSLGSLYRNPPEMNLLPPLKSHPDHHVLIKLPYKYDPKERPLPHPHHYTDKWDSYHVRMPCSNQSEFPVNNKIRRRWDIIESALRKPIPGPLELADAISKYNTRLTDKNFRVLTEFCFDILSNSERTQFFDVILPKTIKLALSLPHLITQPIPLLKREKNKSITLSQEQIACLLANAFLCTFPRRNARGKSAEYHNYPSINFNSLYDGDPRYQDVKLEKLKCIFNYFRRVTTAMPAGVVTFTRQCVDKFPDWKNLGDTLTDIHVSAEGTIEDDGDGLLQVDFANKYMGGGVLGMGAVQEEIRFLICPEMIVTRLFTECLEKNESLIMKGCERFSNYSGYAGKFKWAGDFVDKTLRDQWGRLFTDVVAIDALIIREFSHQFKMGSVLREINKAYSGFFVPHYNFVTQPPLPAVCTGNWGCGAFGGDKRLKALIQLIAATQARREVCYFTFDDSLLRDELYDIHVYLTKTNPMGIGNILTLIEQYGKKITDSKQFKKTTNLFQYIPKVFDGTLENTDSEPESPGFTRSDSREMQYQGAGGEDELDGHSNTAGKSTLHKSNSLDYKAHTP
ncbi:poly(ADP-ribose) glycohydrolase-like isoform X2 [Crassostrea angulata]|uniref:poly(ADP-ribose) glycohydrolase-like isoform X2 n=1 Tax=Magallana angulata TaxID=2784310 RepID=UPI0022B182AE|nr:poly(ADP-ribose) glycohydrolase-like isoform X2 [Crassostrea angulata]